MNLQPVLDALNADAATDLPVAAFDEGDWEQLARAVRHGALSVEARARLAGSLGGRAEALPVLVELSADMGVALAIARSLTSEDSIADLNVLLDDSGLNVALEREGSAERLVIPLARTLADPRAWWWLTRRVFHPNVLTAIPEMVVDAEEQVRKAAVEALVATPGDRAIEALFLSLHDTAPTVREVARVGLRDRCQEPALEARLKAEVRELDALVEKASGAGGYLNRIPGLSSVADAVRKAMATNRAQRRQSVLAGLRRRFRLYRDREDSTAYVALAVAMAWADGAIREYEAKTLDSLIDEYLSEEERAPVHALITNRPTPDDLAPFVARLKDPATTAQALRNDFDIDDDEARSWLRQVARAAALHENAFLE